jgi:hypothetical protein
MNEFLFFVTYTLISAGLLICAMILTGVHGSILKVFAASAVANFVSLIPLTFIGNILSLAVLIWLLSKWTSGKIFPEIILVVIVSWGLRLVLLFFVLSSIFNSD